jgi:hypothetical protein
MALPRLGGSSEVWTACVLFYQITLLGGYGYAYLIGRLRRVRDQALVHGAICGLAALTLPATIPAAWHPRSAAAAVPWLLGTLLVTIGLPFFVLAATSPLVQSWFARARPGRNPYPLYAASNIGSLVALVLYPFVIEPLWGLKIQTDVWALGFGAFVLLLTACAILARAAIASGVLERAATLNPATVTRRLRWVALAFVPSSLMLSVTSYLSERVAPIPLLWTLPLGIYLTTFVIVFATRAKLSIDIANRYTPIVLMPLVFVLSFHGLVPAPMEMVLHLLAFAGIALVCHGALARDRPHASQLTEFYLFVALGGVFGGALNSIIAPLIFSDVFEYPIVIVLACFALAPRADARPNASPRFDYVLPAVLGMVLAAAIAALRILPLGVHGLALRIVVGIAAVAVYSFVNRPLRFGLGVAAIVAITTCLAATSADLHVERNFYGVKRVIVENLTVHELVHGHTVHGAEDVAAGRERTPLTYYSRSGPLGDIFGGPLKVRPAVAVVGLGAGSSACYRQPGANWTFFEIDPGVVAIARNPRYFRYLADCAPKSPDVLGDGRLSLAAGPPNAYDLIILDAYASDAIPTHLLTREAIQLYVSRLRPHGLIAFHISNAYFDFAPLIATLANDAGMVARWRVDDAREGSSKFISASSWIVVARGTRDLGMLARDARWTVPRAAGRVWTDDYSSITTVLRALR